MLSTWPFPFAANLIRPPFSPDLSDPSNCNEMPICFTPKEEIGSSLQPRRWASDGCGPRAGVTHRANWPSGSAVALWGRHVGRNWQGEASRRPFDGGRDSHAARSSGSSLRSRSLSNDETLRTFFHQHQAREGGQGTQKITHHLGGLIVVFDNGVGDDQHGIDPDEESF